MIVYVLAFQHKTEGEGVGGFDWYYSRVNAERSHAQRLASGFYGPNYEHAIFAYDAGSATGDDLTEMIDAEYVDLLSAELSPVESNQEAEHKFDLGVAITKAVYGESNQKGR